MRDKALRQPLGPVRRATADDAPAIAALLDVVRIEIGLGPTATASRLEEWVHRDLQGTRDIAWIRMAGALAVVLLVLHRSGAEDEREVLYLARAPDWARSRLGQRRLEAVQRLAVKRNWKWLTARTRPWNKPAIALLRKVGFRFYRTEADNGVDWRWFRWRVR